MRLAGVRLDRVVLGGVNILIAAFCVFYAYVGAMPWWIAVPVVLLTGAGGILIVATPRPYVNELEITTEGVTRRFGAKLRAKREEKVRWDEIVKVEIETTDGGPFAEDFFFLLHGSGGKGVLVSNSLASRHKLLAELQARLPGLDNRAVIDASGCTEKRAFLVWERGP